MKRRFKTKRQKKIRILFFLFLLGFGFYLGGVFFYKKIREEISPENYLNYLLKVGFNNQLDASFIQSKVSITANDLEVSNTSSLPYVYIYNTHDEEKYSTSFLNLYNLVPNVKIASYYLQEKLNDLGIPTILETRSIASYLKENNLVYRYSYEGSRSYLESTYKEYPSLQYFIDLHRDSSKKSKTTVEIDGISYAKILFIVGLEHDNYEQNLEVTTALNNKIIEKYPTLSRGIYKKSGTGVNGIYNQDFNPNCILIEMGGQENTIEEVSNTIDILAPILGDFMRKEAS